MRYLLKEDGLETIVVRGLLIVWVIFDLTHDYHNSTAHVKYGEVAPHDCNIRSATHAPLHSPTLSEIRNNARRGPYLRIPRRESPFYEQHSVVTLSEFLQHISTYIHRTINHTLLLKLLDLYSFAHTDAFPVPCTCHLTMQIAL
jgi:hypothetical protein